MTKGTNLSDNIMLNTYIDGATGLVDYQKLKSDEWLHAKIEELKDADLSKYSKQEKFAFWLNAYNLFTLKGVLLELEKNLKWRGNISFYSKFRFFFLRKFIIAKKRINLRDLENKILRKQFQDPRLHFAINCASYSCPFLPGRLFQVETLDNYLNQLTIYFINNQNNVMFNEREQIVKLSMIFKWYKKDFSHFGGVVPFIKQYHHSIPTKVSDYKIQYFKYNWELNDQKSDKSNLTLNL